MKKNKNDITPKRVLILTIIFIICYWLYRLYILPQITTATY